MDERIRPRGPCERVIASAQGAHVTLADGRVCAEIMVSPLTALEDVEGVLAALRVGRGFGATDDHPHDFAGSLQDAVHP